MRRFWAVLAAISVCLMLLPTVASADVNDFTVTDFSADETLSRTDPQGQLHIVEHISVDFTDQNHGILRAIPASYKGSPLKLHVNSISSSSGAPTQYSRSSSNGNTVLKIGDPARTVTGAQEYTVDYTLSNVITFYSNHDELYWDVNGDQWEQPFTSVQVRLHLPTGLQQTSSKPVCFAGSYGSTADNCQIVTSPNEVTASAQNLAAQQTLTYVVGFQKGYFAPPTWLDRVRDHAATILAVSVPIILGFVIGFTWWYSRGRDAKGRGTIIPEYAPPDGVSPIEAGTIIDFKVDNRDITAMFIDLARRGYIKIIESRQDRALLKDKITYSLQLTNVDYSALSPIEMQLLAAMFPGGQLNDIVELADKQGTLYSTAKSLRTNVEAELTSRGFFRQNPQKYTFGGSGIVVAVIIFFQVFGHAFSGSSLGPLLIGVAIGVVILLLFVSKLAARTAQGVAVKEHLEGLKLYMNVAEKDRLEKLEGPNAAYAANAGEPVRTVELFEKLLPYAVALGVEKQWAGKFEGIYTAAPGWYVGNWTAFNAGYLVGSLNEGFASAVNTSFSAPRSSGSSGFGGGGFAGGGGGGGGGGGW